MPIDYDDYLDVLFWYWIEDPNAYENDDLLYIFGVSQLLMIYVYAYLCWAWTLEHIITEMFCVDQEALEHLSDWWIVLEALEHMSTYVCVEREDLEHMKR